MSRHATQQRWDRTRKVRVVAGVVILLSVGTIAGGLIVAHRSPGPTRPAAQSSKMSTPIAPPITSPVSREPQSTPIPPSTLESDFAQLEQRLDADIGLVIRQVGNAGGPVLLGKWSSGPAWSTIKVALAIAALRAQGTPDVTGAMRAAIVSSDNDAAEAMWENLGDPETAARKVEEVLRNYGDPTVVESRRLRPQFSAFGQTDWSLVNQATFVADAACDNQNAPIFDLMGQIESDQRWGIGIVADSRFKGGWGPSTSGSYLVRQIGVLQTKTGMVAVAMAAQPSSGSFADGTEDLNAIASWLKDHMDVLPSGQC
jgi:hypothetical protein